MSGDILDLGGGDPRVARLDLVFVDEERHGRRLLLIVAALVSLAVGIAIAVALAPKPRALPVAAGTAIELGPVTPLPTPPDPAIIAEITPDDARASNAALPFAYPRVTPAPAFVYAGVPADRDAAAACLAAATLYEAGDDPEGERAVAQVVLNRLRHPAFPKSVCGVVFQGSERSTGCQFTFTCDGALARQPALAAWQRAEAIARKALAGGVYAGVGTATHYHANYVVPYWRSSLAKLSTVGAHIFYRWPGRWGEAAALTGRVQGPEPLPQAVAMLAGLTPRLPLDVAALETGSAEGEAPPPPARTLSIEGVPQSQLKGNVVRLADADASQYVLRLDAQAFPGSWAIVGYTICAGHPNCLVLGWTSDATTPRAFPVPPQAMRTLAFMYRRSSVTGTAAPFWDCTRYPRKDRAQCLPAIESP